ncbi:peptide ABC transporter substrate-binding protein (plasmid) [Ketogulonicigenium robustum]|uniref:Peptide ABC transporter substrate-binding protein n=1 Tax=Ketogulonicigenium robustum TaxID=92947 RepID=A0A1W6P2Z9_9RHOB|nr:peptide ABC transporter substrate-binding protein [Ketogulonicigenium robustum]ARO15882.1 peptide ABC transporter substrate-binding protein [Ketogulonicigenium robustum]
MRSFIPSVVLASCLATTALAQGSLTYVVNNESATYDPGLTSETFAAPIIGNTFEGLVRFDEAGEVEGAMADSWEVSEDGRTYTFHLRDAKWSDGKPVTAQDFVYAWTRAINPASGAKNPAMFFLIDGAEAYYNAGGTGEVAISAPDDKTFTFTLTNRVPYMLQMLTYTNFFPVRQDVVEADPEGWTRNAATFIGNGPFRVTAFNFGESVVFEKNPEYFEADQVSLDTLTFRLIPEPTTALAAFEAGQVDGIEAVPAPEIPRLMASSDAFLVVPSLGTTYAFFNPGQLPVDDVRVRQALSMAVDRQSIIDFVMQSADVPATGLVPYGMMVDGQDFRDGVETYGLDITAQPEAAQALLAEAGYPDGAGFPSTIFVTYTSPPIERILEAIQQQWKENLNIDVQLQATEWQVFYPEVQKAEFQIAQMGWGADYPHPMTFLDVFLSDSPNNLARWQNPDYDAEIAAAKATGDEAESLAHMRAAEGILMNDHVILPMYHRYAYMMMSPKVEGFWRSPLNVPYFRNASIAQ